MTTSFKFSASQLWKNSHWLDSGAYYISFIPFCKNSCNQGRCEDLQGDQLGHWWMFPCESNIDLLGHFGGIDPHGCGLNIKKSLHDFSLRVNRRSFRNMRGDKVAKYMNTHSQQPKPKFSKSYCLIALNVQHFNVYDTCHLVSFIARCSSFYKKRVSFIHPHVKLISSEGHK